MADGAEGLEPQPGHSATSRPHHGDRLARQHRLRRYLREKAGLKFFFFKASFRPSNGSNDALTPDYPQGGFILSGGRSIPSPTGQRRRKALDEVLQVYGLPLNDVIQEQFGDGFTSAIDFTREVEKPEDPRGARVKITMSGKSLPYKRW